MFVLNKIKEGTTIQMEILQILYYNHSLSRVEIVYGKIISELKLR